MNKRLKFNSFRTWWWIGKFKPKTKAGRHVIYWNREHLNLIILCPKISPDIVRKQWTGKTHCYLQMNQLGLKYNWLKFKSLMTWWWIGSGHCDEVENLPCGTLPKLQLPPEVAMVLKCSMTIRRSQPRQWQLQLTWLHFSKALENWIFANMAVGPRITKTCCSQSGATAITLLNIHKV